MVNTFHRRCSESIFLMVEISFSRHLKYFIICYSLHVMMYRRALISQMDMKSSRTKRKERGIENEDLYRSSFIVPEYSGNLTILSLALLSFLQETVSKLYDRVFDLWDMAKGSLASHLAMLVPKVSLFYFCYFFQKVTT